MCIFIALFHLYMRRLLSCVIPFKTYLYCDAIPKDLFKTPFYFVCDLNMNFSKEKYYCLRWIDYFGYQNLGHMLYFLVNVSFKAVFSFSFIQYVLVKKRFFFIIIISYKTYMCPCDLSAKVGTCKSFYLITSMRLETTNFLLFIFMAFNHF